MGSDPIVTQQAREQRQRMKALEATRTCAQSTRTCASPTRLCAPKTRTSAPKTRLCAPKTRTRAPVTRTCAPATRTPAPETRTCAPTTRIVASATRIGASTTRTCAQSTRTCASEDLPNSQVQNGGGNGILQTMKHGATTLALMAAMLCGLGVFGAPVSASESTRSETQKCYFECSGHGHLSGGAGIGDVGDFRVVLKRPVPVIGEGKSGLKSRVKSSVKTGVKTRVKSSVKSSVKKLSSAEKIVAYLRATPTASAHELSIVVNLTVRAVEKNLRALRESGRLRRVGPDKGGHWEVVG